MSRSISLSQCESPLSGLTSVPRVVNNLPQVGFKFFFFIYFSFYCLNRFINNLFVFVFFFCFCFFVFITFVHVFVVIEFIVILFLLFLLSLLLLLLLLFCFTHGECFVVYF